MTRFVANAAAGLMIALIGVIAYLVLIDPTAFGLLGGGDDPFEECRSTKVVGGQATIGGPFTLINGSGDAVSDTDIITKPTLVYFGYTYCPDVCPFDTVRNAEALDLLSEAGKSAQSVFISIDPERDTPDVISEYASYVHEDMIGLTGSPEQVKAAAAAYKAYYRKNGEGEDYLVDHSTFTYLVLPGHGFVEFFRREETPEALAEKTACFIERSKQN